MEVKIVGVRAAKSDVEGDIVGFRIVWADEQRGFGNIDVVQHYFEGETWVTMDTEFMGTDFVKQVFAELVNSSKTVKKRV